MSEEETMKETNAQVPEISSAQAEVNALVAKAKVALSEFYAYDQEKIDYIVAKCSVAALDKHGELARLAIEETKRGVFEDKATKNLFACEYVVNHMRHLKTVGIIKEDPVEELYYVAEPLGVIAGVTPVTNPTSTAIFKSLIALKTRNPIVFAFHPSAQKSSAAAAKIVYDTAVAAGAPLNCIQWIETPTMEGTTALMHHPDVATILATGGNAMVRAAYSCGKPALGVGAGNVPAYIEASADLRQAINDVVMSKTFDNGMICASEQAIIVDQPIYNEAIELLKTYKAHICNKKEKALVEKFAFGVNSYTDEAPNAKLNPDMVGQTAAWIAEKAGFSVPEDTSILICECKEVGPQEPLTREKLSPVLALLVAKSPADGLDKAEAMVEFNGLGHTACIHTKNDELVREFGTRLKACRICVNSPSTLGGIGNVYNNMIPSLTLGCGSYGHNSVSDNISAVNLLNIKKIGKRRNNMQWFKVPSKIYFEKNAITYLHDMRNVERVFIVTDRAMVDLGYVDRITEQLHKRRNNVKIQLFCDVEPDPDITTVKRGLSLMHAFRPDTIVALGGGSSMDAAKGMWLFYEQPDVNFDDLKQKFMDIRKRAFRYPELGKKSKLVCIPTTSGTGSEVTPFAVISDKANGKKYPLTDYSLTPTVAIVDPALVMTLPKTVTADTGMDVLTHALEAYVSILASDYTDALALQVIRMVFKYLPRAVHLGAKDEEAREKMHNASTMAGMAFANAFLGISHSLAHKIGAEFHGVHGRINAALLPFVVKFNGTQPSKPGIWPKYKYYDADERYADVARMLGLEFNTKEEGVAKLAEAIYNLGRECDVQMSFREQGISKDDWDAAMEKIAYLAYEDQCSPANPRTPIVSEMIKEILIPAYDGYMPFNK